jgi:hypothetical protein
MRALASMTIALVLIVGGAFAEAGSLAPSVTLSLKFDGYADGMHLTINHSNGIVRGNRTGSANELVRGYVGSVSGGDYDGTGVIVGTREASTGTGYLFMISDYPRNFQLINCSTAQIVLSGTWSVAQADADEIQGGPLTTDSSAR